MSDAIRIQEALAQVGVKVNDVYDLVNTDSPYPAAIPILINSLKQGITHDGVKEGVIRALAVAEARGKASKVLLEEYHKLPKEKFVLRWAIGNTMSVVITSEEVEAVVNIVRNKENGISRQMFVAALGNVNLELVEHVLIDLLDDDEVAAFAAEALGKLNSGAAKEKITQLLNHANPLIKKEARKALNKLKIR